MQENIEQEEDSTDKGEVFGEKVSTSESQIVPSVTKSFYRPERKFNSREDLEQYIKELNCFRYKSNNETSEADVSYYNCSLVPKREANKCDVKLNVLESKKTRDFCVYITTLDHNHENIELKQHPVSQLLRDKIYSLKTEYHMKPAMIHKFLMKEFPDHTTPTIKQIRNILPEEKEKYIPKTETYGQLIEWCRSLEKPPNDVDEGFILGHVYNEADDSFAFVGSTLRLLKNADKQKIISSEGTYKII